MARSLADQRFADSEDPVERGTRDIVTAAHCIVAAAAKAAPREASDLEPDMPLSML